MSSSNIAPDSAMRMLDVFASLLGLIILSPLFFVIAAMIKLNSPGPVFHRSQRVGRKGRLFGLYKFRSMVANAEKAGPAITAKRDERITGIGKILRRIKLDELPQLLNVLKGEMSLVGPRPEDPRYVAAYTPEQRQVLNPDRASQALLPLLIATKKKSYLALIGKRFIERRFCPLNWQSIWITYPGGRFSPICS